MNRWSTGLLLLPVGTFTLALFFATGKVVPSQFDPFDQLDFRLSWNGERLALLELHTGRMRDNILGYRSCAFSDDGTR
jgi:hypothetical protein